MKGHPQIVMRGMKVRAQREEEEKAINLFAQHLHSRRTADGEGRELEGERPIPPLPLPSYSVRVGKLKTHSTRN